MLPRAPHALSLGFVEAECYAVSVCMRCTPIHMMELLTCAPCATSLLLLLLLCTVPTWHWATMTLSTSYADAHTFVLNVPRRSVNLSTYSFHHVLPFQTMKPQKRHVHQLLGSQFSSLDNDPPQRASAANVMPGRVSLLGRRVLADWNTFTQYLLALDLCSMSPTTN